MASGTWNTGFWGQNQWNDSANPTIIPTGIALTATLGDETAAGEINQGWGRYGCGEGNWGNPSNTFEISGIAMTANLGQVDPAPDVMLTGIGMTMNEGEEAVTADGIVIPTGIGLTANVGTVYNLIWNEVDTGTTATWKEVDTAA